MTWYLKRKSEFKAVIEGNMTERTIRKGDFILITDPYEGSRYLKIGEVKDIEVYPNGDVKEYTVRFGYNYDTSEEDLDWYNYDLPEKCRVLLFETR